MSIVEDRVWKIIALLVAILTLSIPVAVSVQHFDFGGKPPKSVLLGTIGPIDPLRDLDGLSGDTNLNLSIADRTFDNVVIWRFSLENLAIAPITADEFSVPLQVSVEPPWEIIAIKKSDYDIGPIDLKWIRINSTRMEAMPFLLNPGDKFRQTVYLTATKPNAGESSISVTARIENLKSFTVEQSILDRPYKSTIVDLSFSQVIFLVLVASLYLYWYLILMRKSDLQNRMYIVAVAAISFSAAEVTTYYLFGPGTLREQLFGRNLLDPGTQFQNWIVLIVHIGFSFYLYWRACETKAQLDTAKKDRRSSILQPEDK